MDRLADLKALYEISAALNSSFTTEEALKYSFSILSRYLKIEKIGLFIFNKKREEFEFYLGQNFVETEIANIRWKLLDSLMKLSMDMGEGNTEEELLPVFLDEEGEKKLFYLVPLSHSGERIGFIIMIKTFEKKDDYRLTMDFVRAISGQISVILQRDYLMKTLMREKKYIELLYETSKILSYTFDEEKIIKYVLDKLHQAFNYSLMAFFVLKDREHANLYLYSPRELAEDELEERKKELFQIASREVHLARKDINQGTDLILKIKSKNEEAPRKLAKFHLPFTLGNVISGYFYILLDSSEYQIETEQSLRAIIYHLASALEKAREFHKNLLLANTDGLTGLYNHRAFQQLLKKEFERSLRYDLNLSLIMIDIDFFKKFNDTYGHQIGDLVLRNTAMIIKENARKIDIVARYGGEEFVVVMPETDLKGALTYARRVRENVADNLIKTEYGPLKVTISLGIAVFNQQTSQLIKSPGELIELADKALYYSKTNGRNRVSTYLDLEEELEKE